MKRIIVRLLLCLVLLSSAVPLSTASAQPASRLFPETGHSVADTSQGRFLNEFIRMGGVDALGYPISRPFVSQGFTYQAFQRAVLQWRPEANAAYLANIMDWLSDAGKDDFLASLGISRPLADAGGSWEQVVAERESWLTEPAIARAYRQGGGYNRFGLPASRPEQAGPFIIQRFQRYAFQLWTAQVAGMPAPGSVVGVLAGDLVKQAGLVPAAAGSPHGTGADCLSNPNSVVKSAEVDVVSHRFVAIAFDRVGLEVTVRNNCDEARQIRFSARVGPAADRPPTVVGREVEANFAPGEEKSFLYEWMDLNGTYPDIDPGSVVTFRWNWNSEGATGNHCLDVGAERCLQTDPWLRSTVQELATNPTGLSLLRRAAQSRVTVRYGEISSELLGTFRVLPPTVTLSRRLEDNSELERATVLAHELRHAADYFEGLPMNRPADCLASEGRAFRTGAEVWYAMWGGRLPDPPQDEVQASLNGVSNAARTDPGHLDELIRERYGEQCRVVN